MREREWARVKRKPFPGREEGGGGGCWGENNNPEQPNALFISFFFR